MGRAERATAVVLRLLAAGQQQRADQLIQTIQHCVELGARAIGPETILLVEDEPAIRRLMAVALERAGYRVIQAGDGREALALFDETVNLLLADMRLPHVSGPELIERLRDQQPSLKVLTISGYPLNAPPNVKFLAKPFRRADLLRAIREVLERD
jgi:CheY-like chemotaxis protein